MRTLAPVCVLLLVCAVRLCCGRFEPYKVLGVHRRASAQEIRKAYKAMAKQWHPDKSDDPQAEEKFIEITKAYELLSDPERRRNYDNKGITEDTPNFRQQHDYSQYGRFGGDPFDSFFDDFFGGGGGGGRGFRFNFGGERNQEHRLYHKQSITSKAYWNSVLPNSKRQPYLILFYSDWCFSCIRVEPIWARLTEELEPVGFGIAAVHTEHERDLTRKIGAKELPHMVILMDGKVSHYKDPQFSMIKMLEFVRRKFPYKMVEVVDDSNADAFLKGWTDNRVRALYFGHSDVVRMRVLTTAFRFRERVAFGFVRVQDRNANKLIKRFSVPTAGQTDTLLLFQEDSSSPIAAVSMKDLSVSTMNEVLENNKFLQLPRLSNQDVFDILCPVETSRLRRRLCVTLITRDDAAHDGYRAALRQFAQDFKLSSDRVRFTYVLQEKQADFVKSLTSATKKTVEEEEGDVEGSGQSASGVTDPDLKVAILWRQEESKIQLEWLRNKWEEGGPDSKNVSEEELRKTLQRFLTANEVLPYEAKIRELFDEHAQSLFARLALRMMDTMELLRESITKEEILPALSLIVTVGLIMAGGYVMNYLVKMEEESVQRQLGARGMKVDKKGKVVPELKIHELRAETYNGMVRLLKPGCRTIVLIVDRESKDKLVPKFYKMAWPYRRNKTLMFGFLYIEKGLAWYKKILNLTLPEPRDININPKNCIGTVLSLNGHRRYFCMYHAKHPEGSRKKIYTANNGSVAGAFMGFDSDLEEDPSNSDTDVEQQKRRPFNPDCPPSASGGAADHLPIFEDQLLDGLQMWLDRLFEGSTYRYHINYWPEFPISPAFGR